MVQQLVVERQLGLVLRPKLLLQLGLEDLLMILHRHRHQLGLVLMPRPELMLQLRPMLGSVLAVQQSSVPIQFPALQIELQQLLEELVQDLPPLVIMLAFMPELTPMPKPAPTLQLLLKLAPVRVPTPEHLLVLDPKHQQPE